jgi:hypothetical protein
LCRCIEELKWEGRADTSVIQIQEENWFANEENTVWSQDGESYPCDTPIGVVLGDVKTGSAWLGPKPRILTGEVPEWGLNEWDCVEPEVTLQEPVHSNVVLPTTEVDRYEPSTEGGEDREPRREEGNQIAETEESNPTVERTNEDRRLLQVEEDSGEPKDQSADVKTDETKPGEKFKICQSGTSLGDNVEDTGTCTQEGHDDRPVDIDNRDLKGGGKPKESDREIEEGEQVVLGLVHSDGSAGVQNAMDSSKLGTAVENKVDGNDTASKQEAGAESMMKIKV